MASAPGADVQVYKLRPNGTKRILKTVQASTTPYVFQNTNMYPWAATISPFGAGLTAEIGADEPGSSQLPHLPIIKTAAELACMVQPAASPQAAYTACVPQSSTILNLTCVPECGDGVISPGEGCDDGNTVGGDGCRSNCQIGAAWTCTGVPSVCSPICGDGLIRGGEECDDGNTQSGDGCSSSCTIGSRFVCSGEPSVCNSVCGDGLVAIDEQCDDGNLQNGDGCSASCTPESGWTCAGEPSVCTVFEQCGNLIREGNEQCDCTTEGDPTDPDHCTYRWGRTWVCVNCVKTSS